MNQISDLFTNNSVPAPYVLDIPFPPSVNRYYRSLPTGRVIKSKPGREFSLAVGQLLIMDRNLPHLTGRLGMVVLIYPPNHRKFDLDNRLKSLADSFQKHPKAKDPRDQVGVYDDDEQIDELVIVRRHIIKPKGKATVFLWELCS